MDFYFEFDFALHITWTTYGTWLPGDERGYVANTLQDNELYLPRENVVGTPYTNGVSHSAARVWRCRGTRCRSDKAGLVHRASRRHGCAHSRRSHEVPCGWSGSAAYSQGSDASQSEQAPRQSAQMVDRRRKRPL
jgi:hypothetical protein